MPMAKYRANFTVYFLKLSLVEFYFCFVINLKCSLSACYHKRCFFWLCRLLICSMDVLTPFRTNLPDMTSESCSTLAKMCPVFVTLSILRFFKKIFWRIYILKSILTWPFSGLFRYIETTFTDRCIYFIPFFSNFPTCYIENNSSVHGKPNMETV